MWPIYTVTGFDASAHTSEETVQAARNVPKGMLRSVYVSGLVGWVMVSAFVLAMPDVAEGARQGADAVSVADAAGAAGRGRAGALGRHRGGELPVRARLHDVDVAHDVRVRARRRAAGLAALLKRVSPRWQTPVPAIWTTAALALASTLYAPAYSTLTTACVIFLYLSYVMPTLVGLRAYGRTWTKFGPFRSRRRRSTRRSPSCRCWARLLLVWIGVQPPNEQGAHRPARRRPPSCSPPGGWACAAAFAARPSCCRPGSSQPRAAAPTRCRAAGS